MSGESTGPYSLPPRLERARAGRVAPPVARAIAFFLAAEVDSGVERGAEASPLCGPLLDPPGESLAVDFLLPAPASGPPRPGSSLSVLPPRVCFAAMTPSNDGARLTAAGTKIAFAGLA